MPNSALLPPIASAYAEREASPDGWLERTVHQARGVLVRHARRRPQWGRLVTEIAECSRALDGVTVGLVVHGLKPEVRRAAYACDVTYVTNKDIAFDYLRDRITLSGHPSRLQLQLERLGGSDARVRRLLLRGLVYAIVDEADSVLVDEARTPLIISGAGDDAPERRLYETTLEIATALTAPRDFALSRPDRPIELTTAGRERIAELATPHGGLWTGPHRREEPIRQGLTAAYQMERDKHYLVRDGPVQST